MHLHSLIELKDMALYSHNGGTHNSESLVLILDQHEHPLNLISQVFLEQFNEIFNYTDSYVKLHQDPNSTVDQARLQQLIIVSAKPNNFIAGADLKSMQDLNNDEMSDLIELGQQTFERLHQSQLISIACIHGSCMGGGLELALACDYRVSIQGITNIAATNRPQTVFSLPETQLGLLPAWGGCTRLARIIGLKPALNCILSGKKIHVAQAIKLGLIDTIIEEPLVTKSIDKTIETTPLIPQLDAISSLLQKLPSADLERAEQPLRKKAYLKASLFDTLSKPLIKKVSLNSIRKKTKGHYPAPEKALEVILQGFNKSVQSSLQLEKTAFLTLAQSSHTHNLIQTFFAKNQADKDKFDIKTTKQTASTRAIAVFGGGIMGSGIAYWLSSTGHEIYLYDLSAELLSKSMKRIYDDYAAAKRYGKLTQLQVQQGMQRITPLVLEDKNYAVLALCHLIVEAASESLAIKQQLFHTITPYLSKDTLVATNTSAIPLTELYASVPYPANLLGLHFFNPVSRMPLIEVIHGSQTSKATLHQAMQFVQSIRKTPIAIKDCAGFLVNRILMPYLMQAQQLFFEGYSPKLIDQSMLNLGFPMGPLHLLDAIGLDTAEHVAQTLSQAYPERMHVSSSLTELVKSRQLGVKSQGGFYLYTSRAQATHNKPINPLAQKLCSANQPSPIDQRTLQERLMQALQEEAQHCLDEGIVANAQQLHLALVLGIGFPPFLNLKELLQVYQS